MGKTSRPLCIRVKEHLDGLNKSKIFTTLGDNRLRCHGGTIFEGTVMTLGREPEISAHRTLESLRIAAKTPKINRKDECVALTRDPVSFVDFCGF